MRLATRLWLHGAVLPVVLLTLALVVTGVALDRLLVHGIDDALRSQAAVEAVSLFDLAGGEAHLHIDRSELARKLGEPPAETALYGPDGARVLVWPIDAALPAAVPPPDAAAAPAAGGAAARRDHHEHDHARADGDAQPVTVAVDGGAARELRLRVRSPTGAPYLLLLRRSLAERDAALRAFAAVALAALLAVALALALAAGAQVRALSGRVERLVDHVARFGAGELDADPPADDGGDEIAALRQSVALATRARRDARDAEARLVANAAHELRTPLATMRLEVDLALRRSRDADSLRATLARVGAEVDRLAAMTTALLDIEGAGGEGAERDEVDVYDVVAASVARAQAATAAQPPAPTIALLPPQPGEDTVARVDADAIGRAIDNLLANAARFAGERVEIAVARDGDEVCVRVDDDGPGVPASEAEAVFAPFHRLDRAADGAGLGLAIVRQTAARHGGTATLTRAALGGASLRLRLPAAASEGRVGRPGDLAQDARGPLARPRGDDTGAATP